jgi:predicted metal-dependent HD superfamily phosphohydrolase
VSDVPEPDPPLEDRAVDAAGLRERYQEPHRRYHDQRHIDTVLARVDELVAAEDLSDDQRAVLRLAAWFHDAVYDTTSGDNEELSAQLAEQTLLALEAGPGVADEVGRLVRLTAGHVVEADDVAGAVLCDADLSILAARPDRYDAYRRQVRAEYQHVPDDAFRTGRAAVLRRLLARDPLYATVAARARGEQAARANLEHELATLVDGD